jgi:hypothetical protein
VRLSLPRTNSSARSARQIWSERGGKPESVSSFFPKAALSEIRLTQFTSFAGARNRCWIFRAARWWRGSWENVSRSVCFFRFSGCPRDLVGGRHHPVDGQLAASGCSPIGSMSTTPRSCAATGTSSSTPHYTTVRTGAEKGK